MPSNYPLKKRADQSVRLADNARETYIGGRKLIHHCTNRTVSCLRLVTSGTIDQRIPVEGNAKGTHCPFSKKWAYSSVWTECLASNQVVEGSNPSRPVNRLGKVRLPSRCVDCFQAKQYKLIQNNE